MAAFKHTLLIELATNVSNADAPHRIGGWSESFYALSLVPDEFETLCQKRAALLPNGAKIVGQRYQPVDPSGPSQTASRVFPGTAGVQADQPQAALLCRSRSVDLPNIRQLIIRGIPDIRIVEGEYQALGPFNTALTDYLAWLQQAQWRFRGRNQQETEVPIESVDTNGNFVLVLPLTYNVGDKLQVFSAIDSNEDTYSGFFYVSAKTSSTGGKFGLWKGGATTEGSVRAATIVYPRFGVTSVSRIITRRVGRPFIQYRGRQTQKR